MQDKFLARSDVYSDASNVVWDASPAVLVEEAVQNNEGVLMANGALRIKTGKYTGRSPEARFIVDTPDIHDEIFWGDINKPISVEAYESLKKRVAGYLCNRRLYVFRGLAGADRRHSRKFMVINELASQNLFAHQLLVRPTAKELEAYGDPDFVIYSAPGFRVDPERDGTGSDAAILINLQERVIIIAGTAYCGEIKKSVFSVMNYLLPVEDDVLPMHASVNMNPKTKGTTVFFGLSGTGKTTLSAAPGRLLIGDDEHAWADDCVFNIEGGCYAKCINLDPEGEPEIYNAIRFGSIVENVTLDAESREPDYSSDYYTENTRVAYPVDFIPNAIPNGVGRDVPDVIIFLTADAFGVLPPISRLDTNGAMYHFITGFTSKVAGTERGITEPQPTFSTLFGAPFMPLEPSRYAAMLGERIKKTNARVYLINTGWTGGPYGQGSRMKLKYTRRMVEAAMSGVIETAPFVHDERFNLDIPQFCQGVPEKVMNPRDTWQDKVAYDEQAERLAQMFVENVETDHPDLAEEIKAAGPHPLG
ncbi:MAG: phosphoenolpyruvate carboxykinase (ATP) [Atopobiaceae bacterium]|nr:phosphoenolpyruvate carboxykinase (ATP) [Atopobiaceae bacterium]